MTQDTISPLWLARYRPYPMVILSGILLTLSFPPLPLAFLAYIGFVPLLLVIDQTPEKTFEDKFWGFFKAIFVLLWRFATLQFIWRYRRKPWIYRRQIISHSAQVFRYSYTAFVLWNLGVCYWLMMTAFGAENFSEVLTYLTAGLVANLVNPFLMTLPVYLFTRVRRSALRAWAPWAFVAFWIVFEWAHFNWDLSWSWNTLGHCMTLFPNAIQYIEFTGTLGISMHVLLVNIMIYLAISQWGTLRKAAYGWMGGAALLILLPFLANIWILNPDRAVFQESGHTNVRIIQPNIDPYDKARQSARVDQIQMFDSLISLPGLDSIDLILLPETALPVRTFASCLRNEKLYQPLWAHIYKEKLSLLSGLVEYRYYPPETEPVPVHVYDYNPSYFRDACAPKENGYIDVCNAACLLRVDTVVQTFQKAKLVPMVERMPFIDYLAFLNDFQLELAGTVGGFGKPDSVRNLRMHDGTQIGSLICYESEYGDYVREFILNGADFLTIITNDGWWQRSSGHIQHAHFSTLRSIETRRSIARSANTGISLFTDNRGEIHQATKYWEPDCIDRKIPLYDSLTFYVRNGDYLGWISLFASIIIMGFWIYFNRKTDRKKPE